MVNFKTTNKDRKLIVEITQRANKLLRSTPGEALCLDMDITACHANGCKLKLEELLKADEFNFLHNICGISRNINRNTGKLTNCFLPRFAE